MNLTDQQARALAWRLATRHIANTESWLTWEDVPELAEASFVRLSENVAEVAASMQHVAAIHDTQDGIDSAALEEEARG